MKRFLTLAAIFAACSLPAFAQEHVTEITEGGLQKMRFWKTDYAPGPDFDAKAAVVTGMPITGSTAQLNIRSDAVAKGKVRVTADGREVKTKKILWTGPTYTETTPIIRTMCYSMGSAVNCTSTVRERSALRVRYVNEVSIMFKLEDFPAVAAASSVTVEISGKTYTLAPDQLAMMRDLVAASK